MKCPNPICNNNEMKMIVRDTLTRCRLQKRYICYCGAYVLVEYDLCED